MSSRAMTGTGPFNPHLVRLGQSGVAGEVADVRNDVDTSFSKLEARTDYPVVNVVAGGSALSIASAPASTAVTGTGFLQDQTFATHTFGTGNAALTISAVRPGEPGNALEVKITQGSGGIAATVSNGVMTLELAVGNSTANQCVTEINGDADCKKLFHAVAGGSGASNVLIASQVALAGGVGEGLLVLLGGNEQTVIDLVTGTALVVAFDDFTGLANTDAAPLVVKSNGVCSDPITIGIVT